MRSYSESYRQAGVDIEAGYEGVKRMRKHVERTFTPVSYTHRADVVIGVPDSGLDAALGYARQSGIPYGMGFIKNKYIGRTFISPTQALRESEVSIKLNPIRSVVAGKRVVLIDDSIVRGTTCRRTIDLLRKAGAREIHMLSLIHISTRGPFRRASGRAAATALEWTRPGCGSATRGRRSVWK